MTKKTINLFFTFISLNAGATILNVPFSYPTIQSAILASSNGDTVVVAPGVFYENINFYGKRILLTSNYYLNNDTAFIYATVINGSQPIHPDTASCVIISSGEDSTTILQGFTLTGGKGTKWNDIHGAGIYREGGGVLIELSSPIIRNNLIINNLATNVAAVGSAGGGGIRLGDGHPQILNNVIAFNKGRYGAGIVMNYSGGIIKNNLIAYNTGGQDFGGGGFWVQENFAGFTKQIINNTVVKNRSTTTGGGIYIRSTSSIFKNNIVWGNAALSSPQIKTLNGGTVIATYNDVEGGYSGVGNINSNPFFTDTLGFYLTNTLSPCIDAGDSSTIYNDPEDNTNPGFAELPSLGTIRNDMGAYGGAGASLLPVLTALITNINSANLTADKPLSVYPQPAKDYCYIKYFKAVIGNVRIQLFDSHGCSVDVNAISVIDYSSNLIRLNTSELRKGIYFIKLQTDQTNFVEKLIIN